MHPEPGPMGWDLAASAPTARHFCPHRALFPGSLPGGKSDRATRDAGKHESCSCSQYRCAEQGTQSFSRGTVWFVVTAFMRSCGCPDKSGHYEPFKMYHYLSGPPLALLG